MSLEHLVEKLAALEPQGDLPVVSLYLNAQADEWGRDNFLALCANNFLNAPDAGVFSKDDPRSIARSLKRSADRSRKGEPFRSAMSMLTFYINRAGKKLSKARLKRLEAAKEELRDLYGRRHKTV